MRREHKCDNVCYVWPLDLTKKYSEKYTFLCNKKTKDMMTLERHFHQTKRSSTIFVLYMSVDKYLPFI